MKKIFPVILFLTSFSNIFSQSEKQVDSIKQLIYAEADPVQKFGLIRYLADAAVFNGKMDSVPSYHKELFTIAAQQKNDSLLMRAYKSVAVYLDFKTDTKPELEFLFKALKIAESKYPSTLPTIYASLAAAYEDLFDYTESLQYLIKARNSLPVAEHSGLSTSNLYYHFAMTYSKLGKADSALHYIQLANEYLIKKPNPVFLPAVLSLTGMIYEQLGNNRLAEDYYKNSIESNGSARKSYTEAAAYGEYSRFLLKKGEIEKAKIFGLLGLEAASASQAKRPYLTIVEILRKTYEALHQKDSAYYYAGLELAYRDSLFNQEKLNAVQNIRFDEQIRQKEEEIKQSEEAVQRKHNLQYAVIIIVLIAFITLFLLLSRSIIVKTKFIEFFGVLGLLAVFEFINLFIHPYLAHATNDSPVWMLLILIVIGALLVPLHHKLEKWMTNVMVEKNKKIRLAAAKKTIANLGEETPG
ncbi:MAG: Tetratricopeptide repeat-containing protein [Sediminibacterium sp.]|nr:Tetratricopeptide repeat-containing protein [Sediminibacterium sp.]